MQDFEVFVPMRTCSISNIEMLGEPVLSVYGTNSTLKSLQISQYRIQRSIAHILARSKVLTSPNFVRLFRRMSKKSNNGDFETFTLIKSIGYRYQNGRFVVFRQSLNVSQRMTDLL